ncbi:MAG: EamA family transporter [Candidatus Omnitrophota bacterium]
MMIKVLLFIIVAEIWTAVGQVLLKKSTNSLETHSLRTYEGFTRFIKNVLSKPTIWAGLASMGAGMVVWLMALAQGDLSLVFSIGSIQYVMILFLAHYLLGEKIDRMKLAGTLLVVLGIILITIS